MKVEMKPVSRKSDRQDIQRMSRTQDFHAKYFVVLRTGVLAFSSVKLSG